MFSSRNKTTPACTVSGSKQLTLISCSDDAYSVSSKFNILYRLFLKLFLAIFSRFPFIYFKKCILFYSCCKNWTKFDYKGSNIEPGGLHSFLAFEFLLLSSSSGSTHFFTELKFHRENRFFIFSYQEIICIIIFLKKRPTEKDVPFIVNNKF